MKKIIITANTSWYIYNFRKNTIKHLIENAYEVITVAPDLEYQTQLESFGAKHYMIFMDRISKSPLKDAHTLFSYLKLYYKLKPHIVLNFTPKCNIYSTISAKFMKAKVVNNISGLGEIFVADDIITRLVQRLYKFSQSFADFIFFQNYEDMQLFLSKQIIVAEKCSRLPGSGIDLSYFEPKSDFKEQNIKFILVARMLREKGVELYAKSAEKLVKKYSNIEFFLLGPLEDRGISLSEIDSWEKNGWLKYLGKTDDVASIVNNCSVVVLPSYYREGVPRSLLEAGALGKAIITTNNIGCKETVIHGKTGLLCNSNDLDSLVNCMEQFILMNEKDRIMMGMESRKHIERNFNEKIILENYMTQIKMLSN